MPEYPRRARNWHTAMGLLFIVSAAIVFARQLVLVGPDFFYDHVVNSQITNEKVSLAMVVFGLFLVAWGARRSYHAI